MTAYRKAIALSTGAALIAAETWLAISYIRNPAETWYEQPLVIAVAIAGLAQAVAMSVLSDAWRNGRRGLAVVTVAGLLAAIAFTFSTTYERTAGAREARAIAADQTANSHVRSAQAAAKSAKDRMDTECKVRGPECRRREEEYGKAATVLAAQPALRNVRQLGSLDMVPELALPLMLMLLGFAFIGYAEDGRRPERQSNSDSAQTSFPTDLEPPPAARFQPDADEVAERQRKVADFYRAHIVRHGKPPRHADVMRGCALPRSTASRYLAKVAAA